MKDTYDGEYSSLRAGSLTEGHDAWNTFGTEPRFTCGNTKSVILVSHGGINAEEGAASREEILISGSKILTLNPTFSGRILPLGSTDQILV